MNERVWLQSKITFVNTKLAISLGFLATFLTFSCSPTENSEEKAPIQQETEVSVAKETLPSLPIVWESKPAAAPIVDLAIGKSASGSFYITAILEDGSAESFDLDGIPIARSKAGLFTGIYQSFTLQSAGTALLTHVTTDLQGTISLAFVSPANNIIGTISPQGAPKADRICQLSTSNSPRTADILFSSTSPFEKFTGQIFLDEDPIVFHNTDLTFEANKQADICQQNQKQNFTKILDGGLSLPTEQNPALKLVGDVTISLKRNSNELRFLQKSTERDGHAISAELAEGMSVSAPKTITALGYQEGFVSIDYPKGLIAIAGEHEDGVSKISFVSAQSVWDLFKNAQTKDTFAPPAAEIQALQDALKAAGEGN